MNEHEKINYVELPAKDLKATKDFFTQAFGWSFQDFGPDYSAFTNQDIDGGFFKSEKQRHPLTKKAISINSSQPVHLFLIIPLN